MEIKSLLEDIILEHTETWQSNTQAVKICHSTLTLHRAHKGADFMAEWSQNKDNSLLNAS